MLANCRFSKNFSGSDNNQIKIKGIEHYKISPTEKEFDILDNGTTEAATGGVLGNFAKFTGKHFLYSGNTGKQFCILYKKE